jgi:hypothetical protein
MVLNIEQRRGEIAVLEHRERDGALSTSVVHASPTASVGGATNVFGAISRRASRRAPD